MKNEKKQMIDEDRLRKIVTEEIETLTQRLSEATDYEGVKSVVTAASKLMKALDGFKESATPAMINALQHSVTAMYKTLEEMVNTPASYVNIPKPKVKRVKLRRVDQ